LTANTGSTQANGTVTTRGTLQANEKQVIGDKQHVEKIIAGVYAKRGWGIASSSCHRQPA
jgi:hypothetical protein